MYRFLLILFGVLITMPAQAGEVKTFAYKLGDFDVYALINKEMEHDKPLFNGVLKDKVLDDKGARKGGLNEFVVDTGSRKILFDTGIDSTTVERLEEAGIKPEDINIIFLTHTHFDHIGGLTDSAGKPVFPKAVIYISEEELNANPGTKSLGAYGERVKTFKKGEKIVDGISSEPAFGHTLGHTVYWVESNGRKMLVWGDIIHAQIQFGYPEIYLSYDTDYKAALEVRKALLERVVGQDMIVGGMHLVAPGMGKIKREGTGYRFEPLK